MAEIKITNVPNEIKNDLVNIAKNSGVSLGTLLKPKLREWAATFPQSLKEKKDLNL